MAENKRTLELLRKLYDFEMPTIISPDELLQMHRLLPTEERIKEILYIRWFNLPKFKGKKEIYKKLTFEEWSLFWKKPCVYCGSAIPTIGLDRVDSNKHYIVTNVVSCCWICNRAKREMLVKDFKTWLKQVAKHNL